MHVTSLISNEQPQSPASTTTTTIYYHSQRHVDAAGELWPDYDVDYFTCAPSQTNLRR